MSWELGDVPGPIGEKYSQTPFPVEMLWYDFWTSGLPRNSIWHQSRSLATTKTSVRWTLKQTKHTNCNLLFDYTIDYTYLLCLLSFSILFTILWSLVPVAEPSKILCAGGHVCRFVSPSGALECTQLELGGLNRALASSQDVLNAALFTSCSFCVFAGTSWQIHVTCIFYRLIAERGFLFILITIWQLFITQRLIFWGRVDMFCTVREVPLPLGVMVHRWTLSDVQDQVWPRQIHVELMC